MTVFGKGVLAFSPMGGVYKNISQLKLMDSAYRNFFNNGNIMEHYNHDQLPSTYWHMTDKLDEAITECIWEIVTQLKTITNAIRELLSLPLFPYQTIYYYGTITNKLRVKDGYPIETDQVYSVQSSPIYYFNMGNDKWN